jgi:glucose/arabinose dehydrogenase
MSRITRALLALALLALAAPASAGAAPTLVRVGDFAEPIFATAPRSDFDRLFVVEKAGTVRVIRGGQTLAAPFLDLTGQVENDGERGLLSLAFAPEYASSGLFYVYMVAHDPLGELQIREFRRSSDPDRADPASGRVVWRQAHNEGASHNGGTVEFGPDGMLWFATGDGGGSNDQFGHARDLDSQLGKLLRIDPQPGNAGTYTVPAGNPFGTAVWAYGLRNPFRFSFDLRGAGDLFIGDVGESAREEIDRVRRSAGLGKGADFGWPCREGNTVTSFGGCDPSSPYAPPIYDYAQGSPRAVAGGVVVHDPGLPTLFSRYLYADTYEGVVRSLIPDLPAARDAKAAGLPARSAIVNFGEDACGHVYVVSLSGSVDRIQDGPVGACVPRPGTPGPPAAPAPGASGGTAPDRTRPRIKIRIARKGRVDRLATPRIVLTATEACRVTIRARLAGTRFKRVRTPLRAGRRTTVRLRPRSRRAVQRIHHALRRHKRVTLTVAVTAVDAAGNTRRVTRKLKARRG